jgi:eukaryotic-like serine/threonine-protein kinase
MKSIIKYGIIFFMAVFIAGAVGYFAVSLFTRSAKEIVLPKLTGNNIIDVLETLTNMGLNPKLHGTRFDKIIPKYGVIFQDPPPGSTIKRGRDVVITISKGQKENTLPDFRQVPLKQAILILEKKEFELGTLSYVHSNSTGKDQIIAQSPPALSRIKSNSLCSFLVSYGPESQAQVMPHLTGIDLNTAVSKIESRHLHLFKIVSKADPNSAQGVVLSQTPEFGTPVFSFTPIELRVNNPTSGIELAPENLKGLILVSYPLSPGFLKRHVRVETDYLGFPLDLFNEYFSPGKNINILIPAGIKTKISIFVDYELVKTRLIDPWNQDNDTGELLWE